MIAVRMQIYGLVVEIDSGDSYPDQAHDITNRAIESFASALDLVKAAGIVVYDPEFDPEDLKDQYLRPLKRKITPTD